MAIFTYFLLQTGSVHRLHAFEPRVDHEPALSSASPSPNYATQGSYLVTWRNNAYRGGQESFLGRPFLEVYNIPVNTKNWLHLKEDVGYIAKLHTHTLSIESPFCLLVKLRRTMSSYPDLYFYNEPIIFSGTVMHATATFPGLFFLFCCNRVSQDADSTQKPWGFTPLQLHCANQQVLVSTSEEEDKNMTSENSSLLSK